jgi:hypothetical protein
MDDMHVNTPSIWRLSIMQVEAFKSDLPDMQINN